MARPTPSSVLTNGTAFYAALLAALPAAGASILGPASGYDDPFDGVALDSKWTQHTAGGTGALTVSGGSLIINPSASTGLAAPPNRVAGPCAYQSVTGDFDAYLRVRLRNSTDTGDAALAAFKYACLFAGEDLTAERWFEAALAIDTATLSVRRNWSSSAGALTSTSVTTGVVAQHMDLKVSRRGEVLTAHYRPYALGNVVSDDTGYLALSTAVDMTVQAWPATVIVGPMLRSTVGTDNMHADEFVLRPLNNVGTQLGDRVEVDTWRADGDSALIGETLSLTAPSAATAVGWALWDAASGGNLVASGTFDHDIGVEAGDIVQVFPGSLLVDGADNYAIGLVQDFDVAQRLVDRTWTVLRKSTSVRNLSDWLAEQMQQVDSIVESVRKHAPLAGAYGSTLDDWGDLFGLRRLGKSDTQYRQAIILRAASLTRKLTAKATRDAVKILVSGSSTTWTYREYFPASYEIELRDVDGETATFWESILRYLKPAGVRFTLHAVESDADAFRFDGSGGATFDSTFLFAYTIES
jgi:hypothetical protein